TRKIGKVVSNIPYGYAPATRLDSGPNRLLDTVIRSLDDRIGAGIRSRVACGSRTYALKCELRAFRGRRSGGSQRRVAGWRRGRGFGDLDFGRFDGRNRRARLGRRGWSRWR